MIILECTSVFYEFCVTTDNLIDSLNEIGVGSKLFFFHQVGKAMSSNESAAYTIMRELDVNYVLVIFGGVIGYSGDDINKFLWMVRIAEGEHPKDIRVSRKKISE